MHGIVDKSFAGPMTEFIVALVAIGTFRERLAASQPLPTPRPTEHDSTPVNMAARTTT